MSKNFRKIKNHFQKVDPVIYKVVEEVDFDEWRNPREPKEYFVSLCREIAGQQLSTKVVQTIWKRFEKLFGRKKISPANVLAMADADLRNVGLSWAKVSYIKDTAAQFMAGTVTIHDLHELRDEEVIEELMKIKGVGRWTAEMFLMFTLGREDIFSYGDLGLKNGLKKIYGLEEVTPEVAEEIVAPWSPYKSYGSFALWHSIVNATNTA